MHLFVDLSSSVVVVILLLVDASSGVVVVILLLVDVSSSRWDVVVA